MVGARNMTAEQWLAQEDIAIQKYNEIRQSTDDIQKIAKNTGIPEHKIARIKHHVFYDDTHNLVLSKKIGCFDPDAEIAAAWTRLINGNFIPNDIKLLEHEYFEAKFEKMFKETAAEAHAKTKNSRGMDRDWKPE